VLLPLVLVPASELPFDAEQRQQELAQPEEDVDERREDDNQNESDIDEIMLPPEQICPRHA